MPQPAVIVEWYGPYTTLEKARAGNALKSNDYVLCMALGEGVVEGDAPQYRYITRWHDAEPSADGPLNDAGNQSFYVGWIVSFYPRATHETAEWALIHALRPELNDDPDPCPPGWNKDGHYCGSVCSWFYDTTKPYPKIAPPAGFPTVLTFNWYDSPPDGEQMLRLRLDGCA